MKKFMPFLLSALLVLSLLRRAKVTAVPEATIPKAAPAARLPPKQSPLRPHNVERDHEIRYRYT